MADKVAREYEIRNIEIINNSMIEIISKAVPSRRTIAYKPVTFSSATMHGLTSPHGYMHLDLYV